MNIAMAMVEQNSCEYSLPIRNGRIMPDRNAKPKNMMGTPFSCLFVAVPGHKEDKISTVNSDHGIR